MEQRAPSAHWCHPTRAQRNCPIRLYPNRLHPIRLHQLGSIQACLILAGKLSQYLLDNRKSFASKVNHSKNEDGRNAAHPASYHCLTTAPCITAQPASHRCLITAQPASHHCIITAGCPITALIPTSSRSASSLHCHITAPLPSTSRSASSLHLAHLLLQICLITALLPTSSRSLSTHTQTIGATAANGASAHIPQHSHKNKTHTTLVLEHMDQCLSPCITPTKQSLKNTCTS
eukprot:scaffold129262_cov20-Tisochrysis_lutea.AAC.1